jgi:hypothetical protein
MKKSFVNTFLILATLYFITRFLIGILFNV